MYTLYVYISVMLILEKWKVKLVYFLRGELRKRRVNGYLNYIACCWSVFETIQDSVSFNLKCFQLKILIFLFGGTNSQNGSDSDSPLVFHVPFFFNK
jgi:hypothetical protein